MKNIPTRKRKLRTRNNLNKLKLLPNCNNWNLKKPNYRSLLSNWICKLKNRTICKMENWTQIWSFLLPSSSLLLLPWFFSSFWGKSPATPNLRPKKKKRTPTTKRKNLRKKNLTRSNSPISSRGSNPTRKSELFSDLWNFFLPTFFTIYFAWSQSLRRRVSLAFQFNKNIS